MPFTLVKEISPTYTDQRITYWRSDRTGLQLILVHQQTPIVSGHFAVASEISDDSGCPHTLEHLVFMGSKTYPFKGLLDTLGNKMLSTTNAWTATDQTVYTLVTAGWEGFQRLLPVYLDHVLYPTLTDAACLTEVYHIDGHAEEKGVVFSEMQGVENQSGSLIASESLKLMFSEKSGYSSNTGGLMEKLRVLTNDQIKAFHKLRYRPDNLCIIVSGSVEADDLLSTMDKFDNAIELPSPPSSNLPRPFVDSPREGSLRENVDKEIEFPESDESFGEVQISWKGPDALSLLENTALHVVGTYFTMEGVGKLQSEIVEVPNPLATDVSYYTDDFIDTIFNLYFSGVPTDRLSEVDAIVNSLVYKFGSSPSGIDLEFLRDCVQRKKNKFLLNIERDSETMSYIAIDHFLYGSRDGAHLEEWTKDLSEYDQLMTWTADQWSNLITKYLLNNGRITVRGKPSAAMFERLRKEKEDRTKVYQEKYGDSGLADLGQKLKHAQTLNDRPIPKEVLDGFASPDLSKIKFIDTKSASCGSAKNDGTHLSESIDFDLQTTIDKDCASLKNGYSDFPLYMHFEQYESQFVEARIFLSSLTVEPDLLPYINIVLTELFTLPMELDDGTKLSVEEVVRQVKRDTVSNSVSVNGVFSEYLTIKLQTTLKNYDKLVMWATRVMWNSVFDVDRLKVILDKHLNSVPEEKRDGTTVLMSSLYETTLSDRSLKRASDMILTEEFAENLDDKLNSKSKKTVAKVVQNLESIRKALFVPTNMRVLVFGGINHLLNPVSAWAPFLDAAKARGLPLSPSDLAPAIPRTIELAMSDKGLELAREAYITPMSAAESSYLALVTKCPSDYMHPDIPALAVCCSYLQVVEGPLWRGIRGTGLAYGASMGRFPEMGYVMLDIYRGSDPGKALSVAKGIVDDLLSGRTLFDKEYVQGAISSLVNSLASTDSNGCAVAVNKFFDNHLRKRGPNFTKTFISRILKVSVDDLKRVLTKYFIPMFSIDSSMVFASCHVSMTDNLRELFEGTGYKVTVNQMIGGEDDEEDEEVTEEEDTENGSESDEDDSNGSENEE